MHLVKIGSSAQCTHPWPKLRTHYGQAMRTASCRGARWVVLWPPPRPYRGCVSGVHQPCLGAWAPFHRSPTVHCVARRVALCRSPFGHIAGTSLPCCLGHARASALCRRVWASRVSAPPPPPPPSAIQNLYHDTTPTARARRALRAMSQLPATCRCDALNPEGPLTTRQPAECL